MHQSDSGTSPDIRGAGAGALPGRPPYPQPQSPRPGAIVGVARDVRQRQEQRAWGQNGQSTEQVWTFRIDRHDAQGAALPLVPVEMRGSSFEGSVDDGDWIEAPGVWRPGDTLHPRRVRNLTTGAQMGVRGWGAGRILAFILVLVVVLVMVVVFLAVASAMLSSQPPTPIRMPV